MDLGINAGSSFQSSKRRKLHGANPNSTSGLSNPRASEKLNIFLKKLSSWNLNDYQRNSLITILSEIYHHPLSTQSDLINIFDQKFQFVFAVLALEIDNVRLMDVLEFREALLVDSIMSNEQSSSEHSRSEHSRSEYSWSEYSPNGTSSGEIYDRQKILEICKKLGYELVELQISYFTSQELSLNLELLNELAAIDSQLLVEFFTTSFILGWMKEDFTGLYSFLQSNSVFEDLLINSEIINSHSFGELLRFFIDSLTSDAKQSESLAKLVHYLMTYNINKKPSESLLPLANNWQILFKNLSKIAKVQSDLALNIFQEMINQSGAIKDAIEVAARMILSNSIEIKMPGVRRADPSPLQVYDDMQVQLALLFYLEINPQGVVNIPFFADRVKNSEFLVPLSLWMKAEYEQSIWSEAIRLAIFKLILANPGVYLELQKLILKRIEVNAIATTDHSQKNTSPDVRLNEEIKTVMCAIFGIKDNDSSEDFINDLLKRLTNKNPETHLDLTKGESENYYQTIDASTGIANWVKLIILKVLSNQYKPAPELVTVIMKYMADAHLNHQQRVVNWMIDALCEAKSYFVGNPKALEYFAKAIFEGHLNDTNNKLPQKIVDLICDTSPFMFANNPKALEYFVKAIAKGVFNIRRAQHVIARHGHGIQIDLILIDQRVIDLICNTSPSIFEGNLKALEYFARAIVDGMFNDENGKLDSKIVAMIHSRNPFILANNSKALDYYNQILMTEYLTAGYF